MRLPPFVMASLAFALVAACSDPSEQDASQHLSAPSAGTGGGAGTSNSVALGGSAGASGSTSTSKTTSGAAGSGGVPIASGAAGQGALAGAAGSFGGFGGAAGSNGGVAGGGGAASGASGSGGAAMTDPVPGPLFDGAWAVFKPRCSMCHGDVAEKFGGSDRQAAFTAALIYKEEIARRVSLSRPSFDAMPPSAALPASELAAVKAWLASVM
ncbi:MAG TPA: hypothetical protein VEQ58_17140 [Polyangiaceae bacterium]|nr:hypothetical protein [Polyangiaceae bacterium]